jgi:hypothetical protein
VFATGFEKPNIGFLEQGLFPNEYQVSVIFIFLGCGEVCLCFVVILVETEFFY